MTKIDDYIWQEIHQYIKINCIGCRYNHPSQKQHMQGCFSKDIFKETQLKVPRTLLKLGIISKIQNDSFIKKYYRTG